MEWKGAARPRFEVGEPSQTQILTIEFEPAIIPSPHVAFVEAGSANIWISWEGVVGVHRIKAVADDKTTVESFVINQADPDGLAISTWEVSLQ